MNSIKNCKQLGDEMQLAKRITLEQNEIRFAYASPELTWVLNEMVPVK